MTQAERIGTIVAYVMGCGIFILLGSLLGWGWTFPVGFVFLMVGVVVSISTRREEKE